MLSLGRLHRDEEGQMAIVMLLTVMAIVAVTALSFDVGAWYFDHRLAQNQADAAALAGILELPASEGLAFAAVNDFLEKNGTDAATEGSCPTSDSSNHVQFDDSRGDGLIDTVIVCVRRESRSFFASMAGIDFVKVSALAKAQLVEVDVPYSLMAMDPDACSSFQLRGNAIVNVAGIGEAAGTYTKSDCATGDMALTIFGSNARLNVEGDNDVVGTANSRCQTGGQCEPPATKEGELEDPFRNVPVPPGATGTCSATILIQPTDPPTTIPPGCYKQMEIRGTANLVSGGVYVVTGGVLLASSTGVLNGDNVMFYVTCVSTSNANVAAPCDGRDPAPFQSAGVSRFDLSGIPGSPEYENLAIFVDRTSGPGLTIPPGPAVQISGQGASQMTGAVYAISSKVLITGNGATLNLNIAVVANMLEFAGNGTVNVTYDIELIPPDYQLALVE
jgi:hypothetical protein